MQETEQTELVSASKGGKPLVKGFRDKQTILPLSILQGEIRETQRAVNEKVGGFQKSLIQSYQSMYGVSNNVDSLTTRLEAVASLLGISTEAIDAKVKELNAAKSAIAEAAEDTKLNRKVVDRAAQNGDVVNISFVGRINGEVFNNSSADNHSLTLGSGEFIPGFEAQVVGMTAGTTKDVTVTFPEGYGGPALEGKEAVFTTTLNSVKELQNTEESLEA
jgi:FKBP-type peptidyl-prolyl cis-trans isomerase